MPAAIRFVVALLGVTLLASPTAPAAAPDGEPRDVALVVTDDRGRPVRGLDARAFTVRVDGAGLPARVREVDVPTAPRLLAFLLDEFHVGGGDTSSRVREALSAFADTGLRRDDRVIVLKPLDAIRGIQPLPDHQAVRQAFATFDGRRGDYTARTAFERTFMSRSPETVARERARITGAALRALIARVATEPVERRLVLVISEGFASATTSPRDPFAVRGGLDDVALRTGVAVHVVDPRPDAETDGTALLAPVARRSGGTFTRGADAASPLHAAMQALDHYYVLSLPALPGPAGGWQTLEVTVSRRDARIHAPERYWTPPAATTAPTVASVLEAPPLRLHRSPWVRPWVGLARGSTGLARLTVTWEPESTRGARSRAESVVLKATASDGRVLFDGPLAPVRQPSTGLLALSPRAVFEAPPGQVALEMTIAGDSGRPLDTDVRTIQVPDLHAPALVLSTPEVFRARTAREFAALASDPDAAPVTSRTFSRAERLLVRVAAYGTGERPVVEARLLNVRGEPLRALGVSAPRSGADTVHVDVPLASFAPGEYRVELTARTAARQVRETIVFRLVG